MENGILVGQSTAEISLKGSSFIGYTGEEFQDFELRVKFRIEGDRANSGIQYRSGWANDRGKWELAGYQADFDSANEYTGLLYDAWGRGVMTQPGETVILRADQAPAEEFKYSREVLSRDEAGIIKIEQRRWYEYTIIASDYHFIHWIDSQQTVDVLDEDDKHRRRQGWIGFQLHDGPPMKVELKAIRIRKIGPTKLGR